MSREWYSPDMPNGCESGSVDLAILWFNKYGDTLKCFSIKKDLTKYYELVRPELTKNKHDRMFQQVLYALVHELKVCRIIGTNIQWNSVSSNSKYLHYIESEFNKNFKNTEQLSIRELKSLNNYSRTIYDPNYIPNKYLLGDLVIFHSNKQFNNCIYMITKVYDEFKYDLQGVDINNNELKMYKEMLYMISNYHLIFYNYKDVPPFQLLEYINTI